MRLPPTRALLAFAFLLPCATPAGATAGFAESHSDLVYSDRASLHWIHPGDGCDCGKFCFELVRKESRYAGFRGFNRSIGKINVPAAEGRPLIAFNELEGEVRTLRARRWDGAAWIPVGSGLNPNPAEPAYGYDVAALAGRTALTAWNGLYGGFYVQVENR